MKKTAFTLVWILSFLLSLAVCDQFLLRYPGDNAPLLSDFQHFYKDFRQRLFTVADLTPAKSPATTVTPAKKPEESTANSQPRYIYVDKNGTLSFATTLQEIPPLLRPTAKKLDN